MSVEIGLKGRAEETVTDANTAQAACSGALPVYGTPFIHSGIYGSTVFDHV